LEGVTVNTLHPRRREVLALAPGLVFLDAAHATPPFLFFFRLLFGRTLARENLKFAGHLLGRSARMAVAPASARTAMGWAGAIGTASTAAIGGLAAHELISIYRPEWLARFRRGDADGVVRPDAAPAERTIGMSHEEPWEGPSSNLVHAARLIPGGAARGEAHTVVSHQRPVARGAVPGPSAIEIPSGAPGTWIAVEPLLVDIDRQRLYRATGELQPPILRFE
jgi:hypothetical protein